MIDKRINFQVGGDARDRGMGMAGKTGDYSSGPTGNGGGKDNRFT